MVAVNHAFFLCLPMFESNHQTFNNLSKHLKSFGMFFWVYKALKGEIWDLK